MTDRPEYYVLDVDGRTAVPAGSMMQWGLFMGRRAARRVAKDDPCEGCTVSTVFLGSDHQYEEGGPPLLFETLVFGGQLDQEMVRTSTWDEAEQAHRDMIARVAAAQETKP